MLIHFLVDIIASITSVEYYQSVLSRSFFSSLRFYLAFLVIITMVLTAEYWLKAAPNLRHSVDDIATETVSDYPADLLINWDGDSLSSSVGEVVVPFPNAMPQYFKDLAKNLAVLNPSQAQTSVEALFELTPTKLYMIDQGQRSTGVGLQELLGSNQILIDQQSLPQNVTRVKASILNFVTFVGYFYPIWAWFGLLVSRAYLLVIEGSLIFILIKLQRWPMKYLKVVQLCLHIFVPAEIVNQTTRLAGIKTPISMLMLSFWVLFVVIFFSLQRAPAIKKI